MKHKEEPLDFIQFLISSLINMTVNIAIILLMATESRVTDISIITWQTGHASAWVADYGDSNPWIQVDFYSKVGVTAVTTQGRRDMDQWVTEYQVEQSNNGSNWQSVTNEEGTIMVSNLPNWFPLYNQQCWLLQREL